MAAKLSACLASRGMIGFSCDDIDYSNQRRFGMRLSLLPSRRLLPASCRMRRRNRSSQYKRQQVKKASPEQIPPTSDQPNSDEDSDPENSKLESITVLNHDLVHKDDMVITEDLSSSKNKGQQEKKASPEQIPTTADQPNSDEDSKNSVPATVTSLNQEIMHKDDVVITASETSGDMEPSDGQNLNTLNAPTVTKSLAINGVSREKHLGVKLEDLIGMIKNAEKNILLLNQARVNALEDLHKILGEEEALEGEIDILEMRLAEADEHIKFSAQENIHVELLEGQLDKLRYELIHRGGSERKGLHNPGNQKFSNGKAIMASNGHVNSLSKEVNMLRMENVALKNDIQALRSVLPNVKNTDERIALLENECSFMESSLKDLESKLSLSQEDVSKLSNLKSQCRDLWENVGKLQLLLDKTTKQADQAILVLQKNQELQKKVDKLEDSLEEANVYKLSAEKMQFYNELVQQKVKLLEERLQKSDDEILSYVQVYRESVEEFQDTLDSLKEESKKRALDEPVNNMPWEFWSRLLLIIDGWFLEDKISSNEAELLRNMVWKRDQRIYDACMACTEKSERETIFTFVRLTSSPTSPGLYIVHIAAEIAPVAKVGGLADVVTGLSKALQKKGHLVEIILPKYDCMQYDCIQDFRALDTVVESYFDGKHFENRVWVGTVEGLPVYFIETHHPGKFFSRGQFYGEHDDFKRFSFFSRAALELLLQADKKPDIIHCHDWQTAFVAPLYWDLYAPKGLSSARVCFTCHNFEYQGTAPASDLASCGLDVNQLNRPDRMQDNLALDKVNPVKGAIVFSNIVTTVSPTYAQEVLTAEGGRGLHSTLNFYSKKFFGFLNGIDYDAWNPATDTFLEVQYSANDLQGKAGNKVALRRRLGLSSTDDEQPLVGCITRLVPQKGMHLIRHAIYRTLELGGQFVLLGSSPVAHIQKEFEDIARQFQNGDDIRMILKYDETLSHSIYAASDMLIIPSIFEPCGLTQMIAMRYGSIPIARRTGGLNDSVFDIDDDTIPPQFRNGYSFVTPDEKGVNSALERAFDHYQNDNESWQELVCDVMNMDFSWDASSSYYEEHFAKSVARARAAPTRA